jgi:predicted O-methyltransferase YrrM
MRTTWRRRLIAAAPPPLLTLYRLLRRQIVGPGFPANPADAPFLLPERTLADLFPGLEPGATRCAPLSLSDASDDWTMPEAELRALASICRRAAPRRIFEIGTYTGRATLTMALSATPETDIFTLDLDPARRDRHRHGLGVGGFPAFVPGEAFHHHPAGARIRQLFGDSRRFLYGPFAGTIDLVLIDADHTDEFVHADTAAAFRLLRPEGGIIVWDDYLWSDRHPECAGVTRCVNRVAQTEPVVRLAGTRLAVLVRHPRR